METICRRCLLKDMGDKEYYRTVQEYIAGLPEDMRADGTVYRRRLAACSACDYLMNGMCRLCGCFVEVRAAKQINHCAYSDSKW